MAVWKLLQPHYLSVPGTEWEYKEQAQGAKRQARKVFEVPLYLDPNDPGDQNYNGMVVVASEETKAYPQAYIFRGPPTPEMEPMDEAAAALSEEMKAKWVHPIEGLSDEDYSQSILRSFEREIASIRANQPASPPAISANMVPKEDFDLLRKQVEELTAQLALKAESGTKRI
jgi:hypothetical protein